MIYLITDETHFDIGNYPGTHMPMAGEHLGAQIDTTRVAHGLTGGPDTPAQFYAVAAMAFADQDAMDAALATVGPVFRDIPNFTNTIPPMLVSSVLHRSAKASTGGSVDGSFGPCDFT